MPDQKDIDRAYSILEKNQSLDFVQRILQPENYPAITAHKKLKKGEMATHQMSWGQNKGGTEFYVYPNIVHDNGSLYWLDGKKAADYAEKTNQRITFDNKDDAEWFSTNYKLIWPEK